MFNETEIMMTIRNPAPLRPDKALHEVQTRLQALNAAFNALSTELQQISAPKQRSKAGSWEEIEARAAAFKKYYINGDAESIAGEKAAQEMGCHTKSIQVARKLVAKVPKELADLSKEKVIAPTTLHQLLKACAIERGEWQPVAVYRDLVEIKQALKSKLLIAARKPEDYEITLSTVERYRKFKAGQQ